MSATRTRGPRLDEVRALLADDPGLAVVQERFPADWAAVQQELTPVVRSGDAQQIAAYAARVARPQPKRRVEAEQVSAEVRRYLATTAIKQLSLAAATGVQEGRVRFGLVSGKLLQRLFFRGSGLERKPVSMPAFRLLWPLVRQRRLLLPLVEPKGIFCFYGRPLIRALAAEIGDRSCVEIAAGDGTLSRMLRGAGADVVATDDGSWRQVSLPEDVVRQDALSALRERAPEVVVCSWPPAGNAFEAEVFRTPSVQTYVVVGSGHAFATGARDVYAQPAGFTCFERPDLARFVLPPELGAQVLVFQRDA